MFKLIEYINFMASFAGSFSASVEIIYVTFILYDTDVPKTGVVGLGLVYSLGAKAAGAVALKRKEK